MASAMATKLACASSALKNNFSCGDDGNHNILGRRCRRQLLRERSGCLLCVHAAAAADDGDGGVCENRDAVRSRRNPHRRVMSRCLVSGKCRNRFFFFPSLVSRKCLNRSVFLRQSLQL